MTETENMQTYALGRTATRIYILSTTYLKVIFLQVNQKNKSLTIFLTENIHFNSSFC
jgi:hypothetical protein